MESTTHDDEDYPPLATWLRRWFRPALAFSLSGALSVVGLNSSCSSDEGGAQPGPCATGLNGQCGGACVYDTDCPDGLYCSDGGTCSADCGNGSACPDGLTCSARGRCEDKKDNGFGGGFDTSGGGGSGGSGSACADVDVAFTKQTPTVMLLLDQSSSMTERFGNAGTRWDALYDTLMDPDDGIVKSLEGEVRFGLALYTSHDGNKGGTCPLLTKVSIALNSYASIDEVYEPERPEGDTPTGESITAVAADLAAFAEPGPKIIVLATDGEPDTCAEPNPQNGQEESIAAVQAAFAQGLRTFIVSVGDEVGEQHLREMANAGVGQPIDATPNAPFYVALDQQALIDAFDQIIGGVRSCTITLDGTVAVGDAALGTVTLDGQVLGYDDPNGWSFSPPSDVTLLGTACDAIQSGEHDLRIVFPCDTIEPR